MYSSPGSREGNTRGPRFSRRINRNIAGRIRGLKREGLDDGAHPLVNLLNRSGLPSGILAEPSHEVTESPKRRITTGTLDFLKFSGAIRRGDVMNINDIHSFHDYCYHVSATIRMSDKLVPRVSKGT